MCFNLFDFLLRRSMIWALGSFNSVPFEELASPRTLFWRGWGPEPSCSCRLHVPLLGRRDEKMCFSSLSFHSWSQRHKRSLQFSEHPSLSRSRLFMAIFSVNEKRESTSVQPVRASSLDYPHKTFSIRGGTGRRGGVFHRLAVLEMPVPGAWGWLWGGNSLEWMRYGGSKVCLSIYFQQPEAHILPLLIITTAWAWSKPWPFPTF